MEIDASPKSLAKYDQSFCVQPVLVLKKEGVGTMYDLNSLFAIQG
jgi:hypothetical protein